MNKRYLSEQEIRSRYIRPAIVGDGWAGAEFREEYPYDELLEQLKEMAGCLEAAEQCREQLLETELAQAVK